VLFRSIPPSPLPSFALQRPLAAVGGSARVRRSIPTPAPAAPPVPPPPRGAVPGEPPPPRPVGEAALRARVTSLSALELRQDVRRLARISKAHCLVVLEIVVDPDGRVRSVHPANDECPGLARSLAEQVRRLRFHPFLDEQGVPVAVSGRLNVRFPPPEK